MNKRFKFTLTSSLAFVLGASPLFTLASSPQSGSRIATAPSAAAASMNTAAAPRPTKSPVISKLRPIRLPQSANSPDGIIGQSTTLLPDGRVLKVGGLGQDEPLRAAKIIEPRTDEVIAVPTGLKHARAWHTATMLPDGTVLILGGVGSDGQVMANAEIFNPYIQEFESIPSSGLIPRAYHTATLLTDGRVLIVGGLSKDGKTLKKAEAWDSDARTATALESRVKVARYGHTATLQANGNIVFEGGMSQDGVAMNRREVYSQTSRRFSSGEVFSARSSVDDTPRLEASLPEDGATDVPVVSRVALRFSKPLRVETVNAGAVTIAGPQGAVESKVVAAEGGRLAFITCREMLSPATRYSLSLSGPTDGSGAALPATAITFTTEGAQSLIRTQPLDDEEWVPEDENFKGKWETGRAHSSLQSLAPLQAEAGVTALAGQVLRLNGKPLANVMLEVEGKTTMTDDTGRFLLRDLTAGRREMLIHGHAASRPGKNYGMFEIGVDVKGEQTNLLPYTIWMPIIDTEHATALAVPTTREVVARSVRIPGLEVHVPEGLVLRAKNGRALNSLTLTPLPVDRPVIPLPQGAQFFFTMQTHGAKVESVNSKAMAGIRLVLPNYSGSLPGTRLELMSYDWQVGWRGEGQGTVSKDGKQVIQDDGIIVHAATPCLWVLGPPAYAPATYPPVGGGAFGADPVELSTGLFVLNNTDMVLPDIIPIVFSRTYRQNDSLSRGMGIGGANSYDSFLVGDTTNYSYADLILPDGGRVHYTRTSSGTGYTNAVMGHTSTPTGCYQSVLKREDVGDLWKLKLKNGTIYEFRGGHDTTQSKGAMLVAVQDRYGNRLSITRYYDSKISRITSPGGRWINFSYYGNNVSQITDNIRRTVIYTYDASGRLWKVTNPKGEVIEYGYDSSHRMTTIKDARGITYLTNQYDANGRVIKQTQADATFYQIAYTLDANGKVTQADLTDPKGYVRRVTFNASGHVLTDTYAQAAPEQQTYTYVLQAGTNFVQSVTDQLSRRTDFSYDSMGNVTSITRLAGTSEAVTMSLTYNSAFNQVATITDPLNHTIGFNYDVIGNLTGVTDALNHQTTFGYNSLGQMTSVTDALMHTMQIGYEAGDPATITDPLGNTSRSFVDGVGRLVSAISPAGQTVKYETDGLNRVTKVIDPLQGTTQFQYDPNGNLLSVTDARNKVISYHYDNMDRVDIRTDPLLKQTTYLYDANSNLRQLTDRKNQVTTYSYDALNRLKLITYADSSTKSYTYDAGNRLTQVVDSIAGTISYGYDNLDRLISETTAQGVVSYTYDAAGRVQAKSIPGQTQIAYTYDAANRLTQIQQGTSTVTFAYDDASRLQSQTLSNGVATEYGYDNASRLTLITYKKGGVVLGNLTYGYDAAGRRTKVAGSLARTGLPQAVTTATYDSANRQTGFASQTLTYDDNGQLTGDGTNIYTWNARGQMVGMSGPGVTASFSYDAVGRRSSKTINSATTIYLYDGANIAQELVGGSASANNLTGGVDRVVSRTDTAGTVTPLVDALGSTIGLVDASGEIETSYSYEPFGNTTTDGAGSSNTQKYTGREDDGTGLYYYRARYYSPLLQRFISEDPTGLAGGINLYAYAGNDPINFSDPFGLKPMGIKGGTNPLLNNPHRRPPDWKDSWKTGSDNRGGYSEDPDTGRKYYPHEEDDRHWDHYDWKDKDGKEGRYPDNSVKPRPGQKRRPYGDQSGTDPWPAPDSSGESHSYRPSPSWQPAPPGWPRWDDGAPLKPEEIPPGMVPVFPINPFIPPFGLSPPVPIRPLVPVW